MAVDRLRGIDDSYRARALMFWQHWLMMSTPLMTLSTSAARRSMRRPRYGVDLQVSAAMAMACVLAERTDPAAVTFADEAMALGSASGSVEQLAAAMPTAAMACWLVGDLAAARRYVDTAWPMHTDRRRIARVVLLFDRGRRRPGGG